MEKQEEDLEAFTRTYPRHMKAKRRASRERHIARVSGRSTGHRGDLFGRRLSELRLAAVNVKQPKVRGQAQLQAAYGSTKWSSRAGSRMECVPE